MSAGFWPSAAMGIAGRLVGTKQVTKAEQSLEKDVVFCVEDFRTRRFGANGVDEQLPETKVG